jgi:serine/threonine-protein kinase
MGSSADSPTFGFVSGSGRSPGGSSGYASAAVAVSRRIDPAAIPDFGPRYRVEGRLGEGGMGSVYKAYDIEIDRVVALKVIRPELMANAEILQRFKQELLLASRVSHKHILRIHDLGDSGGVKFISMAYVDGRNLAEVLHEEKVLPIDRAIEIAMQICQALGAAHQEDVVHRDLKPQNVLLDKNDSVYVSDFGLAKSLECDELGATAMTSVGQMLGTPRYMSPEQVECSSSVDGRADIYSFGLMLYEMVTGQLPFQGNSLQLMLSRVQSMPRNPSLVNSKLPAYLVGIIMRCLEKDPQRRYQTFESVLEDLKAERFTAPGKSPAKRFSRSWSIGLAVAVILIIAAASVPLVRHYLPVLTGARFQLGKSTPQMLGKHVAVVPFRIVGDDPKLSEAAVGFVDTLNSRLFQVKGVTVVSSSATATAKPADTPEKLSRDLGANLLLLGSIQGTGDKIRLELSLWDANQKSVTWSKEESGMFGDLLTLEDETSRDVLKALDAKDADNLLNSHPTENGEAYDLYLRAATIMRSAKDAAQLQSAIDLYQQASQTDPRFALAYAGLADAQVAMYRMKKDASWANLAVNAAHSAAELNAQLPEVHLSLGNAYSVTGRTAEALDQLKQAIALVPNSDEGYRRLGAVYASSGKPAEAINAYKKAVEINPYYWGNYNRLGVAYQSSGQYENAVTAFSKVVEIEPDNGFGYGNLGSAFLLAGKFQEAITPLQKAIKIAPTATRYSNLGIAYYYLRQYDLAIELFEKSVQLAPTSWMYVGNLADAYRLAGHKEAAAGTYEKAINLAKNDLAVNPRNAITMGGLGLWYAKSGDVQQGRKLIAAARSIDAANVDLVYFEAQAAALANDTPAALAALREAFAKGLRPAIAEAEPDLGSLKVNTDFQQLLRQFSPRT